MTGRQHLTFTCNEEMLAGTLDHAPGRVGLLIVSGGNEIRSGPFGGQADLAARIARQGYPCFRFDRRGIGDSEGDNRGFASSGPDIAAACDIFRKECPQVTALVAFGNCDAASALALFARDKCDSLVLANPWIIENDTGELPPHAIRQRYVAKLRRPAEWRRLFTGRISITRSLKSFFNGLWSKPRTSSLAHRLTEALSDTARPVHILIAERDRTAQSFMAVWNGQDQRIAICPGASHAFVESGAREWLTYRLIAILDEEARQLDMR
ncbi:hydrolase 1, exosortase A system-associated [Altericroceibacterium spongiae]|uniref:Hydrolase 1, exosortase A system-associated n=1 Tax=Altericroceibacterium spongiae TaxID=2320269 RepID=A0A420ERI3_9SPHN|nr:hydrolase 1, exosortase A system-associated [Altericroceibacterium spongiae]RKF23233.1 hydrolase 1, exosortase A system-associated [Altericroceibacterium spongiae]